MTVEIGGLRITPFICYDLRFANVFWEAAERTDVYLVTANWPATRRHHWTTLLQARIQSNSSPLLEPSSAGLSSRSEALNHGVLAAYTGCFRTMAIVTAITLPGVLLFRVLRPDSAAA